MVKIKTTRRRVHKGSILLDCVAGLVLTGIALTTMALGLANISFQRKAQFNDFVAQQSLANALEDIHQQTQSAGAPEFDSMELDDWAAEHLPAGKLSVEEGLSTASNDTLRIVDVEVQWQGPAQRVQKQAVVFAYVSSDTEDSEQ